VAVFATTGAFITGVNSVSGNVTGGNVLTGGLISATGNITGNFFLGNGSQLTGIDATSIQSGTSNVRVVSSGGNVATGIGGTSNVVVVATTGQFVTGVNSVSGNITGGNILTGGLISATGNITGGNLSVGTGTVTVGNIVNSNGNGVGNIGNATGYFNTIFAKATSAQYADLAEMYVADADYPAGTVVEFGGDKEITISSSSHSTAVAGIVSTNPSYLMNSTQQGEHVLAIALTGRVPCRVQGPVRKGDVLVASSTPGVAQRIGMNWQPGCVVGKSMEVIDTAEIRTIEVAVGRL
jgi:hypothetical protein